jgi:hypothetical protein
MRKVCFCGLGFGVRGEGEGGRREGGEEEYGGGDVVG